MKGAPKNVVVAGAGLAGLRVVETLRAEAFAGRIVLVGDEPLPAYERPALSKDFLAGRKAAGQLALRTPRYLADADVCHLPGWSVRAVDLSRRRAILDDGRELPWEAFVLATGARPRRLPVPTPAGVHVLRTLTDAHSLRAELLPGRRLAVVGGGFVGAEVASAAVALGLDVTLVDSCRPLERVAGHQVAELLSRRFHAAGVQLRLRAPVTGFDASGSGRVRAVVLADGSNVPCDVALVGIGVTPASELLPALRAPDGGITVDACGHTAAQGVYAAGDVASAWRPWLGARLRVEHWTGAAVQGATVAHAILGRESPDATLPYFWSDILGLRLQHVGYAPQPACVELEGDDESFRAGYLDREGRLTAVMLGNRSGEVGAVRRELEAQVLPVAA